ncbi:MAG: diaminopimelate dehydrogenase [Candidatus Microthrix parvicella]|nr:diaminopimelate dehydrogenase [Candidatus Microthrix parvicella]
MSIPIRIGITGYGNLGRGAEAAITQSPDLELVALVTRRDPATVIPADPATPVVRLDDVSDLVGTVDVMLCCGGSKEDLPVQGPLLASMFNIVDSYDTHARIPEYFASVDAPARDNNTTAVISTGWDPGLFSINRLIGEAILPEGATYSFWGRGLSQGHSDAVRRVDGVAAGVQYTNPTSDAVARARSGERPELTTREKHTRHCFVVLTDGADADEVEQAIVMMPDYFVDYDTTVTFIDADTLAAEHDAMPHGGVVIRSASTADGHDHTMQFSLELGHNPSFTAGVVVAYARAAHRMNQGGDFGAKTPFDVAPGLLSPRSPEDLRRDLL